MIESVAVNTELITITSPSSSGATSTQIGSFLLNKYLYGFDVKYRWNTSFSESNAGTRSDIMISHSISVEPSSSNRDGTFTTLGLNPKGILMPVNPPKFRGGTTATLSTTILTPKNVVAGSESLYAIYRLYFSERPDEFINPESRVILESLSKR